MSKKQFQAEAKSTYLVLSHRPGHSYDDQLLPDIHETGLLGFPRILGWNFTIIERIQIIFVHVPQVVVS